MEKTNYLLASAINGDEQMLNTLLERYRPEIYNIALKICGNSFAAEDAAQDALITAYTNLYQLKNPAAFLPWLKRITINCCYQAIRKENKFIADVDKTLMNASVLDERLERIMEHLPMRDSLYTSLSCLPEAQRHAIMLRYWGEHNSYPVIAQIMGIPIGTVRSRLSEGKKQLLDNWKKQQDADDREFKNAQYWNKVYTELFPDIYRNNQALPLVMNNLRKDMELVFTSGKSVIGSQLFAEGIYDDFEHGSSISSINFCISSGNLTVMNMSFANSAEYPDHCPANTYLTIHREKGGIKRMSLFHAHRNDSIVRSPYA